MPNGRVLAKLWSKKIRKNFLPNVAYNPLIFPTETAGLQLFAKCVTLARIFTKGGRIWDLVKFREFDLWPASQIVCELTFSTIMCIRVMD